MLQFRECNDSDEGSKQIGDSKLGKHWKERIESSGNVFFFSKLYSGMAVQRDYWLRDY
jgi:hypothetical protein